MPKSLWCDPVNPCTAIATEMKRNAKKLGNDCQLGRLWPSTLATAQGAALLFVPRPTPSTHAASQRSCDRS